MSMKRVIYHGHTLNQRTENMLKRAEARLGYDLTIIQGSYNHGVGASAGTHDGGGAVDLAPWDYENKVRALREVGFAAWHRPTLPGVWDEHIHAVAIGDPELSPAARAQVSDYYDGRNGLADNGPDNGPRLHPIPVWPVPLGRISLPRVQNQFKADHPRKTPGVEKIQRLLNRRLGTNLVVDGVAGPKTKAAYKKWEQHVKAPSADGLPGPESLRELVAGYFRVIK